MACDPKNLRALTYINGFTLWRYTTSDTKAEVENAGYFNNAAYLVLPGDIILTNVNTDGTPGSDLFLVNSNTSGVVDVASLRPVGNNVPKKAKVWVRFYRDEDHREGWSASLWFYKPEPLEGPVFMNPPIGQPLLVEIDLPEDL